MNFEEQISDKQIERSLWFIQHKALINKIIISLLIITILGLYGFSLFKFINIKIGDSQNNLETSQLKINLSGWKERNQIKELIIVNKDIISLGRNKFDVVVEIKNPNERVALSELKYKFIYGQQESEEKNTFLLSGESKKLIDFNVESNKIIRDFEIEIINTNWERLSPTEAEKLKNNIFAISDEKIHLNPQDNARNWIEFKVINDSPYNWQQSKFYVSLYLGTKLIAINEIKTEKFYSSEQKNLKTSWFQKIPSYITVNIIGETNLLDPENYIDPQ